MKKHILVSVISTLLIGSSFVYAQGGKVNLKQELNLTPDQVTKIKSFSQTREKNRQDFQTQKAALQQKMQIAFQKGASNEQVSEIRAQLKNLQDEFREKQNSLSINSVLTPQQKEKYQALKNKSNSQKLKNKDKKKI